VNGGLLGSKVVNRTAAFVFFLGDHYFGTVLAFVPGKEAAGYGFTSALAVQVLKDLTPTLTPLLERERSGAAREKVAAHATRWNARPAIVTMSAKPVVGGEVHRGDSAPAARS